MTEQPTFVITVTDYTDGLRRDVAYYARNWTMTTTPNQLHLVGEFVNVNDRNEWQTKLSRQCGKSFNIALGGQRDAELLQEAEDYRRVQKLSDHLIGLTEKFIESNLSHEFKEILKRTPTTVSEMGELMAKGLNKALEKLGKGK